MITFLAHYTDGYVKSKIVSGVSFSVLQYCDLQLSQTSKVEYLSTGLIRVVIDENLSFIELNSEKGVISFEPKSRLVVFLCPNI